MHNKAWEIGACEDFPCFFIQRNGRFVGKYRQRDGFCLIFIKVYGSILLYAKRW